MKASRGNADDDVSHDDDGIGTYRGHRSALVPKKVAIVAYTRPVAKHEY